MSYFMMGGPLFMGLLTLILLAILVVFFTGRQGFKELGILALTVGILGQLIGLFSAFEVMESSAISQSLLAGGLKVSSITTIYGMLIYILSVVLRFISKVKS